jgi:hypothetical protein
LSRRSSDIDVRVGCNRRLIAQRDARRWLDSYGKFAPPNISVTLEFFGAVTSKFFKGLPIGIDSMFLIW